MATSDVQSMSKAQRRLASLTAQEPAQAHVRRRLGLPERDPAALRRVAERYETPEWAVGCISVHDANFLYDMVRGTRGARVIEIGVASGASTALLLVALADAGVPMRDEKGEPTLRSFDLHPCCYFDRSRWVGAAVAEMAPELGAGLRLKTGETAIDAGKELAGRGVELAFVDGDHRHPWAAVDVLALAPALAPGAWVVLHDIRLADAARAEEERSGKPVDWGDQHGPQWLFEAWPWEKMAGGTIGHGFGATNIGAVRMPERRVVAGDLKELLARTWEIEVPGDALGAVGIG